MTRRHAVRYPAGREHRELSRPRAEEALVLQRLKDLLLGNAGDPSPAGGGPVSSHPPEVAVAALLLESASADDRVHLLEHATIAHGLSQQFGLDAAGVERVLAQAEQARRDSISLHDFTSVLLREYDERRRIAIAEVVWRVVLADGELTSDESILARRLGNLLELRPADVGLAIRRARER